MVWVNRYRRSFAFVICKLTIGVYTSGTGTAAFDNALVTGLHIDPSDLPEPPLRLTAPLSSNPNTTGSIIICSGMPARAPAMRWRRFASAGAGSHSLAGSRW